MATQAEMQAQFDKTVTDAQASILSAIARLSTRSAMRVAANTAFTTLRTQARPLVGRASSAAPPMSAPDVTFSQVDVMC